MFVWYFHEAEALAATFGGQFALNSLGRDLARALLVTSFFCRSLKCDSPPEQQKTGHYIGSTASLFVVSV
jgi:hypothetical protein